MSIIKKAKNESVIHDWTKYRSFKTYSEAKNLGNRLELIRGEITKVVANQDESEFWLMVSTNRVSKRINYEL